jgi:hypothetical protein
MARPYNSKRGQTGRVAVPVLTFSVSVSNIPVEKLEVPSAIDAPAFAIGKARRFQQQKVQLAEAFTIKCYLKDTKNM